MVVEALETHVADGMESGFGADDMTVKTMVAAYEERICLEILHNSNPPTMEEHLSSSNPMQQMGDQLQDPIVFATTRCIRKKNNKKNNKHRGDMEYVPKYRYNRSTAMENNLPPPGRVLHSTVSQNTQTKRNSAFNPVKGTRRRLKKGCSSTEPLTVAQLIFKNCKKLQRSGTRLQTWRTNLTM